MRLLRELDSSMTRLGAALVRDLSDELPPNIALMHLVMEAERPADVDEAIAAATEQPQWNHDAAARLRQVASLWQTTPAAFDTVKRMLAAIDHGDDKTPARAVAQWRSMFDRAADVSPEASAALYSLGRADLLAAATEEIVARMRNWGVLARGQAVLEIGCGIGRFVQALAPDAAMMVGLDISANALAVARRRCRADNVLLVCGAGRDLNVFGDAVFDLAIAVDVFPYLVQSGLAAVHFADAARVLRSGGRLLVLNYSYRGNPQADCREVAQYADANGFVLSRHGTHDFALWDGITFLLERRDRSASEQRIAAAHCHNVR